MTRIGADPDDLDALRRQLDSLRGQLERSGGSIDAALRRTVWRGRDADDFRSQWSGQHRQSINRAASTCGRISEELARHVAEQKTASADVDHVRSSTVVPTGDVGTFLTGLRGPARGVATRWTPDEMTTLGGTLEATIMSGLLVGGHRATVESYGDRRVVTITTRDAAGVRGTIGGSLHLGSIRVDASARGDAVIGVVQRKSFETDPPGTTMTVIGAELDGVRRRLATAAKLFPLPATTVMAPISEAIDTVGRTLGILPEPTRTETLAEVALTGSVAAVVPMGPGGGVATNRIARVGVSEGSTGSFYVVEVEGTITDKVSVNGTGSSRGTSNGDTPGRATSGTNSTSPPAVVGRTGSRSMTPDRTYLTRVEIHTDTARPMAMIRSDVTDGSLLHRTTTMVSATSPTDATLTRGLLDSAADIGAGRIDDAIAKLTDLNLTQVEGPTLHTTYAVSTTDGAVGGSIGEGLGLGGLVSVEGSRMVRVRG